METIILNFLSLISGGIGTFISITKKDTWDNKGPTKTGWIAIAFLVTSSGCQFAIQWLDYQERKILINRMEKEYTGWVSIGSFSDDKGWTCDKGTTVDRKCPYLIGINSKTKPEEINTGDSQIYFVSTDINMYNRSLPKEKCPPGDFNYEEDFKVTLKTDWKVKILEKQIYSKCSKDGKTRVLLKVSRVL